MIGTIAVIREKGKEAAIVSSRELSDRYAAFFNYVSEKRICFTGYDQVIQDEKDRQERMHHVFLYLKELGQKIDEKNRTFIADYDTTIEAIFGPHPDSPFGPDVVTPVNVIKTMESLKYELPVQEGNNHLRFSFIDWLFNKAKDKTEYEVVTTYEFEIPYEEVPYNNLLHK